MTREVEPITISQSCHEMGVVRNTSPPKETNQNLTYQNQQQHSEKCGTAFCGFPDRNGGAEPFCVKHIPELEHYEDGEEYRQIVAADLRSIPEQQTQQGDDKQRSDTDNACNMGRGDDEVACFCGDVPS